MNILTMRIVLTVLLLQALIATVILHVISGTFWFTANWNPSPGDSGIERQRYVQSTRESGTILIGVRSQPTKQSPPTSYKLNIEGPRARSAENDGKPREGKPLDYVCGISITTHHRPEQQFHAFYMNVRLWLIETILAVALAGVWTPALIRLRRKPATPTS